MGPSQSATSWCPACWPVCPMGPPKRHVPARPLSYVLLHLATIFPSLVPKPDTRKSPSVLFPSPNVTSCGQFVRAVLLACPISLYSHTILLSRPFYLLQEGPPDLSVHRSSDYHPPLWDLSQTVLMVVHVATSSTSVPLPFPALACFLDILLSLPPPLLCRCHQAS